MPKDVPKPESAPVTPAARPSTPAGPHPLRVLLVEDHNDTRHVMVRLLTQMGYSVTPAATVSEAIEFGERRPFDLVLSDIGLPDGSGLDVIRHLKSRGPIRGIAVSGFGQDDDRERSLAAGFDHHLTKPLSSHQLQTAIYSLGGLRPRRLKPGRD